MPFSHLQFMAQSVLPPMTVITLQGKAHDHCQGPNLNFDQGLSLTNISFSCRNFPRECTYDYAQ